MWLLSLLIRHVAGVIEWRGLRSAPVIESAILREEMSIDPPLFVGHGAQRQPGRFGAGDQSWE
jgi:hypothetical protein